MTWSYSAIPKLRLRLPPVKKKFKGVGTANIGGDTRATNTGRMPVPQNMPPPTGPFGGLRTRAGLINGVGGIEEDTIPDGTVNLADFARFADNWKTNP